MTKNDELIAKTFQFHIGTIKRGIAREYVIDEILFQFHIGTIKSRERHKIFIDNRNFNSTLVRLKAS